MNSVVASRQWPAALPALDDPRVTRSRSASPDRNRCPPGRCRGLPSRCRSWPPEARYPSATKSFVRMSNSRMTVASDPPRDKADQRQRQVGFDDVGPAPDPVLSVGGGQRVEVDQNVPFGIVGSVALERGAPPQPARVVGVAPEVVQVLRRAGARTGCARRCRAPRGPRWRIFSNSSSQSSASVGSLWARTQFSASSPVMSSSQRCGSRAVSSGMATLSPRGHPGR